MTVIVMCEGNPFNTDIDALEKTEKYEQPYHHHCCKDVNPEIHSMMYVLRPLGYDSVIYRSNVDHISSGQKRSFLFFQR
jgi:hypothetical protein